MKLRKKQRKTRKKNFLGCSDKLIEVGFDHIEWVREREKICIPRFQTDVNEFSTCDDIVNFTVNCTCNTKSNRAVSVL